MVKGYIKDFRKELHSDIWMMPPLYHRVWQFLKYKVNHKDNRVPMRDGSFMMIKAGQHLTSMRKIANQVGYYEQGAWKEPNPKTIKSILSWLEKQNMISISNGDGNRKYTLITLLNWELYQVENEEGNSKYTASTQSMDINKNDKECTKNDLSSSTHDSDFAEAIQFYQSNLQAGVTESPYNNNLIIEHYEEWGSELLIAAMKLAAQQEKKGTAFLGGILNNWHEAGVKNIEDARKYEKEFKANNGYKGKGNVVNIKGGTSSDEGDYVDSVGHHGIKLYK